MVAYSYDSAGNIVDIDYSGTRMRTAEAIRDARVEIETRTAQTVYELGEAKLGAIQQVEETIGTQIRECDCALQELYASLNQINSWNPFWSWDKKKKNSIRNDIENSIAQVRDTKQQLVQASAEAYEQIDEDIAYARGEIDQEYEASMAIVREREENAEREILEQEVEQLLYIYYMKILGRNPGREEIAAWMIRAEEQGCLDPEDRVVFDVNVLRSELLSSDEYGHWTGFNDGVRRAVGDFLRTYTSADTTAEEKLSRLQSLGITADEVDGLNGASWGEEDVEVILDWMSDTEINFGRCAFETVMEFLDRKGIQVDLKLVAIDLILTDILAGAIDCFTDGPLEISLYAMNTYINRHLEGSGESVYSARIDMGDLRGIIEGGGNVVAHLDNDHYVTVTAIDEAGNVTYFDTNNGADGESVTIDEITFRMHWTGYVLSDRAPPIGKTISDTEALSVRGNLDPFSAFILWMAIIATVLSFIDNEICQTVSKILGVATLVFSAIAIVASLPSILTNFYTGISNASSAASSSMGEAIGILSGGIEGLVANLSNIAQTSVNFISAISYNVAITQGLSFLNINSDLAMITASFMTGGFMMPDNYLAGALTASARTGISIFGRETGLDPFITDLLATSACALGTVFMTGIDITVPGPDGAPEIQHLAGLEALSHSWNTTVMPRLSEEMTYLGIQKLGELTGLDPRISYLAGISIRSSLQMGFSSGGGDPGAWLAGAISGATQGISQIGINYLMDKLNLPPIVEQMGSQLLGDIANTLVPGISSMIFHSINSFTGNALAVPDKPYRYDPKYWSVDGTQFNEGSYVNDMANWSWQNTGYQQMSKNLTQEMANLGFKGAMDTYSGTFLNDDMAAAIDTFGIGAGQYFQDKIDANDIQISETIDGVTIVKVGVNDNLGGSFGEVYFAYNEATGKYDDLYGYQYGDFQAFGDIFVDPYSDLKFFDGMIVEAVDGYIVEQMFSNGMQEYIQYKDLFGEVVLEITPLVAGGNIYITDNAEIYSGQIVGDGYVYTIDEGVFAYENTATGMKWSVTSDGEFDLNIDNTFGLTVGEIALFSDLNDEQKKQVLTAIMFFGNGFGNDNPEGHSPTIMRLFMQDLLADGIISPNNAFGITTYEGSNDWFGLMQNSYAWALDAVNSTYNPVANEITSELYGFLGQLTSEQLAQEVIYFSHSGQFRPLIESLNNNPGIGINTIFNFEGPFVGEQVMSNTNVNRVINVYGTQTAFDVADVMQTVQLGPVGAFLSLVGMGDDPVPFLGPVEFTGLDAQGQSFDIQNYNFEIIGARHSDFSYNPNNTNLTPEQEQVNIATNFFMRQLAEVTADDIQSRMDEFLMKNGITLDESRGVLVVNPIIFMEENNE